MLAAALLLAPAARTEIRVTDDLGRVVNLLTPARRVVSLAPSLTESLFAIGAGGDVVGRTIYCNYPAEALRVPTVGGMTNPSIESIVARRPDLIVVSMEGNTPDDFRRLASLGVPLYVSNPRTLEDMYRSLDRLGVLTGREGQARRLVDSLQRRERELRAMARPGPLSALVLVSLQPLMAAGSNTLLNELLTLAGALNPAASLPGHYPVISREMVIANPPDVLFLTGELPADAASLTSLFPEWKRLRAMREGRVYSLDADIVSRPGPRSLEALRAIIDCLSRGTP